MNARDNLRQLYEQGYFDSCTPHCGPGLLGWLLVCLVVVAFFLAIYIILRDHA